MSFRDEDLDQLERLTKKRKFGVQELVLTDVVFSTTPAENMARFLKLIGKDLQWLEVLCDGVDQIFLISEFFDLIPVDCSQSDPIDEEFVTMASISPAVHTLPPDICLATDLIFPFETLKKAIHSWWRDEAEVECWEMHLPIAYTDRELFAKSVDLPYTISNGHVVFQKTDGSVLSAQPDIDGRFLRTKSVKYIISDNLP